MLRLCDEVEQYRRENAALKAQLSFSPTSPIVATRHDEPVQQQVSLFASSIGLITGLFYHRMPLLEAARVSLRSHGERRDHHVNRRILKPAVIKMTSLAHQEMNAFVQWILDLK